MGTVCARFRRDASVVLRRQGAANYASGPALEEHHRHAAHSRQPAILPQQESIHVFPAEVTARLIAIYEAGELVPACAWCGRVNLDGEWLPIPRVALDAIDAPNTLSHSICPDCLTTTPPGRRSTETPGESGYREDDSGG
jgi:hypothetical protein